IPGRAAAGSDIRAIDRKADSQLTQSGAKFARGEPVVGTGDLFEGERQSIEIRAKGSIDHCSLGIPQYAIEVLKLPSHVLADFLQRSSTDGIDKEIIKAGDELVACGAVDGPISGQCFLAAQDLLHREVKVIPRRMPASNQALQPVQVSARVAESVDVIEAQPL